MSCRAIFYSRVGCTKQDPHSSGGLATSLTTVVEHRRGDEKQYVAGQVGERESSILDHLCAVSLPATKETVPQSAPVIAAPVYSNISVNATHHQSNSDVSVTYITHNITNATPIQQQQQIAAAVHPISQFESLRLGAVKAKPWVIFLFYKI